VRLLQQQLTTDGFDPGGVDGIFGPRTERAVLGFQAQHSLTVDGIAGPQTWGALRPM
jgi:peptidoglycan hydrolase-like protein with peptidoglycan-binding domain